MTLLDIHLILNELKRKEQRQIKDLERTREKIKTYKAKMIWESKQNKKII